MSNMELLQPAYAAALAGGVYEINKESRLGMGDTVGPIMATDMAAERALSRLRCEPDFILQRPGGKDSHPFARSTSGGAPNSLLGMMSDRLDLEVFKPVESDFGYVAMGKGEWDRHMIVVTRGTMGKKGVSADWISNFNVGLQVGPTGLPVHAGFRKVWAGFQSFMDDAMRLYRPDFIHCVGHSLGGALANLNAAKLAKDGRSVALYTFGAPRVGTIEYAADLHIRMPDRIKRVWHPADPVPMIPLMPFVHAPLSMGIRLNVPAGALIDFDAHAMEDSYENKVGTKQWKDLEAANTVLGDFQIDSWLQRAAKQRGGYIMRSAALLERIGQGLARLVARALVTRVLSGLSMRATQMLTALDMIAWLLSAGAAKSKELKEQLTGLVNAVFGFMGRVGDYLTELSQRALRWVLGLLFDYLAGVAWRAIDRHLL